MLCPPDLRRNGCRPVHEALWSLGEHRGEEEEACEAALLGFLSAGVGNGRY